MPSPAKGHRKTTQDKNRKGPLSEKATSFHGRGSLIVAMDALPRPRTVPELLMARRRDTVALGRASTAPPKPTKLLLNVTIQRSTGALHVLLPPEASAEELIATALRQYFKEARRPVLSSAEASAYDLHYSQFTLESLDRKEKLIDLGSRNFFLSPRKASAGAGAPPSCSKEVDAVVKNDLPLLKFMNFML